jgi:hypothetical protein
MARTATASPPRERSRPPPPPTGLAWVPLCGHPPERQRTLVAPAISPSIAGRVPSAARYPHGGSERIRRAAGPDTCRLLARRQRLPGVAAKALLRRQRTGPRAGCRRRSAALPLVSARRRGRSAGRLPQNRRDGARGSRSRLNRSVRSPHASESRGPSRLPASRRRAARRAIGSAFEGTPSRPFPRSSCLARSRQRRDASGPSRGTQGPAA